MAVATWDVATTTWAAAETWAAATWAVWMAGGTTCAAWPTLMAATVRAAMHAAMSLWANKGLLPAAMVARLLKALKRRKLRET